MLCREIIQVIEASYPREAALDFDNVGLLAGRAEKEVNRIYLALDATDHVIDSAEKAGADMLITHHPLIFSPVKKVTDEDFTGRRLLRLIRSDISYYAMHTNYDVLGMAELSERILDIRDARVLDVTSSDGGKEQGIGRIGNLEKPMTLSECCAHVRHSLKLGSLKVFGDMERIVYRIAVSPGAGKSEIPVAVEKGADVLVTGDIDYHTGIDAAAQGLCIVDAGHYGTESMFIGHMKERLAELFPTLEVETARIRQPFVIY